MAVGLCIWWKNKRTVVIYVYDYRAPRYMSTEYSEFDTCFVFLTSRLHPAVKKWAEAELLRRFELCRSSGVSSQWQQRQPPRGTPARGGRNERLVHGRRGWSMGRNPLPSTTTEGVAQNSGFFGGEIVAERSSEAFPRTPLGVSVARFLDFNPKIKLSGAGPACTQNGKQTNKPMTTAARHIWNRRT